MRGHLERHQAFAVLFRCPHPGSIQRRRGDLFGQQVRQGFEQVIVHTNDDRPLNFRTGNKPQFINERCGGRTLGPVDVRDRRLFRMQHPVPDLILTEDVVADVVPARRNDGDEAASPGGVDPLDEAGRRRHRHQRVVRRMKGPHGDVRQCGDELGLAAAGDRHNGLPAGRVFRRETPHPERTHRHTDQNTVVLVDGIRPFDFVENLQPAIHLPRVVVPTAE